MGTDILLATDGRARSDTATEYALAVARLLDAELEVLYVVDQRLLDEVDAPETKATLENELRGLGDRILADAAEHASDLTVGTTIRRGRPSAEILEEAAGYDVVVLGRDIEHSSIHGSVSSRAIAATETTVLSVPATARPPPADRFTSMLVPTDGSQYPVSAMADAIEWLAPNEAHLHGLYVIDSRIYDLADAPRSIIGILREGGEGALADLAVVADDFSVTVRRHIRRGEVTPVILDTIDELDPQLVALGSRGRSSRDDPILGSTTRALLAQASVPLVLTS